jgi:gamma-glutamyltranspeptidase/glutathione hydrolase
MMAFQLMGGDMQAQGHAQVLVNMLELGSNLQAATDMARFRHAQVANTLGLESQLYDLVGKQLGAMGHNVRSVDGGAVGGYHHHVRADHTACMDLLRSCCRSGGYYRAGSDHRKTARRLGGDQSAREASRVYRPPPPAFTWSATERASGVSAPLRP